MTRKTGPMTTARKRRGLESGILGACIQLLAVEHIFHRRWNSGSALITNPDGSKRSIRFGTKGDADIFSAPLIDGRPAILWIETKSETGRQTLEQKVFQQIVEAQGHFYLLTRDVTTLQAWLKSFRAKGMNVSDVEPVKWRENKRA